MSKLKITYTNLLDHKGDFGQGVEIYNQHLDGEFPKSVLGNVKTIGLTLNRTKLSSLPSQLEKLKKLERLDLSNNDFDIFPEVICELDSLRYLNLSRNKLTSLPRDIIYLRKLEEIVLDNNLFEEFPEALFQSSVEDVSFKKNKLKCLPPGINAMTNLKILVVTDNQLKTLPVELSELPQLTELFASANQIKGLPENFVTKARSLKKLNLQGNPLVYPSAVSAAKGVTAVREYEKKNPRPDIPSDDEEPDVEEAEGESRVETPRDKQGDLQADGGLELERPTVNGDVKEEEKEFVEVSNTADEVNLEVEGAPGQVISENGLPEEEREQASPDVAPSENQSVDTPAVNDTPPSATEQVEEQTEAIPEHFESDEMQQVQDETEIGESEVPEATTESSQDNLLASVSAEPTEGVATSSDEQKNADAESEEDNKKAGRCPSIIDDDTGEVESARCPSEEPVVSQVPEINPGAEGIKDSTAEEQSREANREAAVASGASEEEDNEVLSDVDSDSTPDTSSDGKEPASDDETSPAPEGLGQVADKDDQSSAPVVGETDIQNNIPPEDDEQEVSATDQIETKEDAGTTGEKESETVSGEGDQPGINERLI